MNPVVGIIMGSENDRSTMLPATGPLDAIGVTYEVQIVSAHRTPEKMFDYAKGAKARGLKVIVAGAGGAAHLPGMTASLTTLPVIGVPITSPLQGWDSILSVLQMPQGVPVATVGLNAAFNAGLLAAKILAVHDPKLHDRLLHYTTWLAQP